MKYKLINSPQGGKKSSAKFKEQRKFKIKMNKSCHLINKWVCNNMNHISETNKFLTKNFKMQWIKLVY